MNTTLDAGSPQKTPAPTVTIGHYQLQQCLGEGGFGQVYEAWDEQLQRRVAIKRLKQTGAPPQNSNLLREARLAAALKHPAFVKVYALEHEDEQSQSIVMELVDGQTVRQLLAQQRLNEASAIDIVRQVAQAMQEAHAMGMIHGDLKPSNLMQEPGGQIRILDFGLARQIDGAATTSMLQLDPQGTVAYMAPERLLGEPLSPLCDIYALGVILYELLSGQRPLGDLGGLALAAAQVRVASTDWPWPDSISPPLKTLICAMTAREPGLRLKDMRQVSETLASPLRQKPQNTGALLFRRHFFHWRKPLLLILTMCAIGIGGWQLGILSPLLPASIRPFSEAGTLKAGLAALDLSDRPGSLEHAEASFNTVLAHNPNNAAAVAGLAVTYIFRYRDDDHDEIWLQKADAATQQAIKLNTHLAIAHAANAYVLAARGQWEMAQAASARALALDDSNILAIKSQINALIGQRHFEQAKHLIEQTITRFPSERIFVDLLGLIFYEQGDYKAAEQAYRQSIKLQPDAVYAYASLFATLSWQNRQDEGMKILQEGLQIRPSPLLYGNLGNALFVRGDYTAAAAAFEKAVSPHGGNPTAYLGWANLADTLLWLPGRKDEARAAYQKAADLLAPRLTRQQNDFTLVSRMGLYYARTGKKAEAEKLMTRATTLAPKNANVRFRAGLAHELLGNRQIALREIALAVKLGYPVKLIEAEPDLLALRRDAAYLNR